jgi:hypothetical protein
MASTASKALMSDFVANMFRRLSLHTAATFFPSLPAFAIIAMGKTANPQAEERSASPQYCNTAD